MFGNILSCFAARKADIDPLSLGTRGSPPHGTQVLSARGVFSKDDMMYVFCNLEAPVSRAERSCPETCQLHTYFPYSIWGTIP